jgi:hypothetical protein
MKRKQKMNITVLFNSALASESAPEIPILFLRRFNVINVYGEEFMKIKINKSAVSHIPQIGNAPASPVGDTIIS